MKIVFVCTGNACRSAVAEVVLKKMIEYNGITGVEVASCGTKVHDYLERDEMMCRIAADHGGFSSEEQMNERYINHKPFYVNANNLL